jgi:hypothetical protein
MAFCTWLEGAGTGTDGNGRSNGRPLSCMSFMKLVFGTKVRLYLMLWELKKKKEDARR